MRLTRFLLALAFSATALPAFAAEPIGLQKISVVTQDSSRALAVTIWYPSKADGTPAMIGESKVFDGVPVRRNARIQQGRFPLILLSHGSGSRAEGMAWIAESLAEAGFIVAGPNHPGTTSGDSTPAATPKIWERTQDISSIISTLSADAHWQASIDPNRIGVLGFSLGGSTALELAGARGDLDAYIRYCRENPDMMDCSWFRGGRGFADGEEVDVAPLDLASIDKARFEQSNRDKRIASVVAVDPGLATALKPESLTSIGIPVTLINLGSPGSVPVAVLSDRLADEIPGAGYAQVDNANHFSFLPICKASAAEFLASIGEQDPICQETARPRIDIHAELEKLIIDAFTRTLKAGG
ncbi:alpha/beta fold hydrolase [Rhizobium sp. BK376]|uniref:alpha/beta hydrolase family protein n=1 Tax=Rhizobium sp. BK376 TaxID=2512149 RepID=UPI0010EF0223|nr:alpha/beta fold hydrolase [Rhizobium sp. BK376]TCR90714.1 putative dienelactone hydrolase [Rhizobium sp. BK376]